MNATLNQLVETYFQNVTTRLTDAEIEESVRGFQEAESVNNLPEPRWTDAEVRVAMVAHNDGIPSATVTLLDYANDRENVVLFYAGVGCPAGDYTPLGHPDMDFADRRDLLGLNGTVGDDGDWRWDGDGSPTDDNGNTIYKLHAYADAKKWAALVEEYENC